MGPWPIEKHHLSAPNLEELAAVIDHGLKSNFNEVSVEVTACPDLRQAPFGLAAEGISGNERIADVGGIPHLHPTPKFDRTYSLLELMKAMDMQDGFVLGAGAGPFHQLGGNAELMPNLSYDGAGNVNNLTHFAKITTDEENGRGYICQKIPSNFTDCALMVNLFGSDGRPGNVIRIVAKKRTGELNFLAAIQETLRAEYGQRPISIGGVFLIRRGKASLHVMPDFSSAPLEMNDAYDWLRFFEVEAPLVALTAFHSYDPGLGLRMEHAHCISDRGVGGHYHYDTTPDEIEYEAYLNTAKILYRIDKPEASG